ncbi:hypothetical protein [Hymenobacter sp. HDW8]|uniref:hypothetical protein n=1 Tax=Hymenobacter sp. HDW8 TaxID=2714932 RepID=UPI001408C5DA|nr:hypothetical protein [Hymenobacter sp. HDW8]QIL76240.1 hypothetical protein G7064_10510 [Hymenobacter sp. HDW8]
MLPFTRIICRLTLLLSFVAVGLMVQAQSSPKKPAQVRLPIDSTKVYTYVEHMPVYSGAGDMKGLTADFLREFQAASAKGGCSPHTPVFVSFVVGPSGGIYDVTSVHELQNVSYPKLSATCETALIKASQNLSRFKPGMQNNRRVAVRYILKLSATK